MYNNQKIADRIKKLLKENGTTTKEMTEQIGIGINSISEFAKGKQLSFLTFAKIADYLNCSTDYLLGRSSSPEIYKPINKNLSGITMAHDNEDNSIIAKITPEMIEAVCKVILEHTDNNK